MSFASHLPLLVSALLGAGTASPALAAGHFLRSARLTVGFATNPSLNTSNNDRVDSIVWTRSDGSTTGNLAVNSVHTNEFVCGDPAEFFGQSAGGQFDQTPPSLVEAGDITAWRGLGHAQSLTRKIGNSCGLSSAPVRTQYKVFGTKLAENEMQITRTFDFGPGTPLFPSDIRAYIPRINAGIYSTDLIPDVAGTIHSYDANSCGGLCTVTDWNGSWVAEDDGQGNGMMIIRSRASLARASAAVDVDAYSGSNASSVLLAQPASGWNAPVVEVEYLCFYDQATWSAEAKRAGRLPRGCALR
jgi:hypothetical protein